MNNEELQTLKLSAEEVEQIFGGASPVNELTSLEGLTYNDVGDSFVLNGVCYKNCGQIIKDRKSGKKYYLYLAVDGTSGACRVLLT